MVNSGSSSQGQLIEGERAAEQQHGGEHQHRGAVPDRKLRKIQAASPILAVGRLLFRIARTCIPVAQVAYTGHRDQVAPRPARRGSALHCPSVPRAAPPFGSPSCSRNPPPRPGRRRCRRRTKHGTAAVQRLPQSGSRLPGRSSRAGWIHRPADRKTSRIWKVRVIGSAHRCNFTDTGRKFTARQGGKPVPWVEPVG